MAYLQVNDANIYYEVFGDIGAENTLCLLNGFTRPLSDFYSFSKHLSKHDVPHLLIDHRGCGKTIEYVKTSLSIMANDVIAVFDHIGLQSSHLLGISMGGIVSQEIRNRFSERVEKLFLVSTATQSDHIHKIHFTNNLEENIEIAKNYFSKKYLQGNLMLIKAIAKQVTEKVQEKHALEQSKAIQNFGFEVNPISDLYFIHGKEDKIMPIHYLESILKLSPGINHKVFEECGHLLLVERPKEFYEYVISSL